MYLWKHFTYSSRPYAKLRLDQPMERLLYLAPISHLYWYSEATPTLPPISHQVLLSAVPLL